MIGALLLLALAPQADLRDLEANHYAVDYLTPPQGEILEVGGLDFLSDGRLVLSTRRGQVWIVEDPLAADPADARFHLFAEGLWEGLGLKVVDDEIYVVQRGELSRLRDVDGDGRCDHVDTVSDAWGLSGNYHEFAYGLPVDDEGNFYVSLNVAFFSPKWWHGKSTVPHRGWVLKIAPDGTTTPFAHGFRSPCGLDRNEAGELFATDNQGDWMAVSPVFHVQEGRFYGHPASLAWTEDYLASQAEPSDTVPPAAAAERAPAAAWLPYKWSRSPGNLVEDATGGAFGPFEGQQFLAELTNGMVVRVMLEKVRGEYQGAVIPFRRKIGSACRVRFASDGTLFVGMTNRGWGGQPPASGLARVRYTGEEPFEIERVHLVPGGFQVFFTQPLGGVDALFPHNVRVQQYDYDYWWEYGSPVRNIEERGIKAVALSGDRRMLQIDVEGLAPALMASIELFNIESEAGAPLLHPEVHYTVNQLAEGDGPDTTEHVVKVVPPPPGRESGEEGWLRLTFGDATDGWNAEGWELVDAEVDPDDPTRLMTKKGVNALCNTQLDTPSDFVSKQSFGDAKLHVEFMLPEGGESGVVLMDRYEIRLKDSRNARVLTPEHCTGIAGFADGAEGVAPNHHAYAGAGLWHKLDVEFQAPRFDAAGNKVENARLVWVKLDDTLMHENVELAGPTLGYDGPEAAFAPLALRGTGSDVAFGNIRIFPRAAAEEPGAEEGWTYLFTEDDDELVGWSTSGNAIWYLEDGVLIGEGPMGHVFSPRGDYEDFEVRARVKINVGGNSGLYFRAQPTEGWPKGYEAQINSSFADPQKTGSLYSLSPVLTHLVASDTWFDYHVTCRAEGDGTRVVIRVNGVVFTDYLDVERRYGAGHIALQQHHDGSVVEVKELRVREL